MRKAIPWTYSTEPDEDGDVKDHVDARLQGIILCLDSEPIIPSEDIAGGETGQDIVASNEAVGSDDEQLSIVSS